MKKLILALGFLNLSLSLFSQNKMSTLNEISEVPFQNQTKLLNTNAISNGITFTLLGNLVSDKTTIQFDATGTTGYDKGIDSLKSNFTNTLVPYISSVINGIDYQTNYLPNNIESIDIPIRVKVAMTGKYVLIRDSSLILPNDGCLFLEDLSDNSIINLNTNSSYSFTLEDTTSAPRFIFHITHNLMTKSIPTTCNYMQNGQGIIKGATFGTWTVNWMDNIGNIIATHSNVSDADTLKNLAPGKYPVQIVGNLGACNSKNDTVFVQSASAMAISPIITHESCPNSLTGQIHAANVLGGSGPYSYSWSNGSTSSINSNLTKGIYVLILKDSNGCSDTTIYQVFQLSNITNSFSTNKDTVSVSNALISTINNSSNYSNLSWNFGDGYITSQAQPSHNYLNAGTYTIELTTSDNYCTLKTSKVVTVLNWTSINSTINKGDVKVFNYDNSIVLNFDLLKEEIIHISLMNIEGKVLNQKTLLTQQSTEILTSDYPTGTYLISVEIGSERLIKKLVINQL